MNNESTQIFGAALSLPPDMRADLAYRLLQTLKPSNVLSEDDPGFAAELERRMTAYEAGEATASDWDAVSQRLRKALDDRNSP